jgi:hypothetical protein
MSSNQRNSLSAHDRGLNGFEINWGALAREVAELAPDDDPKPIPPARQQPKTDEQQPIPPAEPNEEDSKTDKKASPPS